VKRFLFGVLRTLRRRVSESLGDGITVDTQKAVVGSAGLVF